MRVFEASIVLAAAVAAVVVLACEPLPDGQECPESGLHLYVDTEHCSKYWECYNGCANHMTCEKDHLYDDEHKWCNVPEKVYCGDRDCDGRPCSDTPPENGTFVCPDDGYFPDPKNCIKYYHCYEGIAEHITCQKEGSAQLCYDPGNVWCNWCSSVECGERPICDIHDEQCKPQPEHTTTSTTSRKPSNCDKIDCTDDGFFAEGDCEQCFCECVSGYAYEFCCEDGLVFNDEIDRCDWTYNIPECKP